MAEEPTFVPCTPYTQEVYDISTDGLLSRKVSGFWVRVYDKNPENGMPLIEVYGKFIGAMPKYD